jgi:hypothetical protein
MESDRKYYPSKKVDLWFQHCLIDIMKIHQLHSN